ncbi:MAG: hypothetical protein Q8Q42_02700 [Nanoarchaeota archaeon]|nr:hypothetical protein [Nanoarchaeota archaeon]
MKNKIEYVIYGVIVILVVAILFNNLVPSESQDKEIQEFKSISSGSTDTGDVSIELKPKQITDEQIIIDISVNTHSVDLSPFNLEEITTLEFDGKEIKPVSAIALSGHHSSGEIIFKTGEEVKSFTIKIKGIPNVDERVFEWQ